MKTNNNNHKKCRLQRRRVKEEEELGSLDPGRHNTRFSLFLYASLSLYGGLGFLAVKDSLYMILHLKFAFEFEICRKTLDCRPWSRSVSDADRDHSQIRKPLTLTWSRSIMYLIAILCNFETFWLWLDRDLLRVWSRSTTAFSPEILFSSSFRSIFAQIFNNEQNLQNKETQA